MKDYERIHATTQGLILFTWISLIYLLGVTCGLFIGYMLWSVS